MAQIQEVWRPGPHTTQVVAPIPWMGPNHGVWGEVVSVVCRGGGGGGGVSSGVVGVSSGMLMGVTSDLTTPPARARACDWCK